MPINRACYNQLDLRLNQQVRAAVWWIVRSAHPQHGLGLIGVSEKCTSHI
jgi:hypothetical protein